MDSKENKRGVFKRTIVTLQIAALLQTVLFSRSLYQSAGLIN
jgi:hypothetical protein